MGKGVKGFKPLKSEKGKSEKAKLLNAQSRTTERIEVSDRRYLRMLNCDTVWCTVLLTSFKWFKDIEIRDKTDMVIFKVRNSVSYGPHEAHPSHYTCFEMARNFGFIVDFPEYDQPEPQSEKILSVPGLF